MVSKRILCASLALACAGSGCGADARVGAEPGRGLAGRSSVGAAAGSGSSPGNGGSGGDAGDADGPASEGGGAAVPGGAASVGSVGSAGAAGGSSAGQPSDAAPSAGCGRDPEFQSGTHELEVGGLARTFIVDLPGDYTPSQPYPLLFGFHGRDFSGAEFRSPEYGDLLSAAGSEAIVVHPDTTDEGAWELESSLDVELFDALLEALGQGLCVDRARVFATGHSSGGYFTNVLGCRRAGVLRAIAPVAGGGPGLDGAAPACSGPLPVWIAHSEDDETVPFSNGEGSLAYWLGSDACDPGSVEPALPEPCVAYTACAAGLAVRWCAYDGGHDWPSFAAQGIWDFFRRF